MAASKASARGDMVVAPAAAANGAAAPPATATRQLSPAAAAKLTELLLLARSTHGSAAVAVIRQAIDYPALFAFAELIATPNITAVRIAIPVKVHTRTRP